MQARADSVRSPLLPRELQLIETPAGFCESRRDDAYRLSMNAGAPVWGTCLEPGRARRYLRDPGSINFAPPGATVAWQLDSRLTLLKLSIPRTLIKAAARDLETDAKSLDFRCVSRVHVPQIEWLTRALYTEDTAGNPNGLIFSETLSLAISMALIRQFADAAPVSAGPRGRLTPVQVKRISDYVYANLGRQDLSVSELASVAGTSFSHFKALFKRSTGVAAYRFVVQCRVTQAALLLRRGHLTISEVAAETGFSHATHLARWTRRLLGTNPAHLREG